MILVLGDNNALRYFCPLGLVKFTGELPTE